jgi:hypothetical protein
VSKRSDRRRDRPPREADGTGAKRHVGSAARPSADVPTPESRSGWSLALQLAFLVAVVAVVTLIAELAGAANLGVALGAGQVAFAVAVIYLLVRR